MRDPSINRLRRIALWLALDLLVAAGLLALSARGDTSLPLRPAATGGCYCCCGLSKTSAGCKKMCELPKYASRWWAVTCSKPHAKVPVETPNAQPHLPHPSRAERASN